MGFSVTRMFAVIGAFIGLNTADSVSRPSFSRLCKPFPEKRIVLVMVNGEYVDFFKNWLYYAKPHLTKTEQLVVVAEDEKAYEPLRNLAEATGFPYIIYDKDGNGLDDRNGLQLLRTRGVAKPPWMSEGYTALMRQTPGHILQWLHQDCSVLYADIDAAWMKNPFEEINKAGHHEFYFTDDRKAPDTTLKTWTACGCFLYMHPTSATTAVVEGWNLDVQGKRRNQVSLNQQLRIAIGSEKPLDFAVLPHDQFPPGRLANENKDATVYHANWISGCKKKKNFFRNLHIWHDMTTAKGCPDEE